MNGPDKTVSSGQGKAFFHSPQQWISREHVQEPLKAAKFTGEWQLLGMFAGLLLSILCVLLWVTARKSELTLRALRFSFRKTLPSFLSGLVRCPLDFCHSPFRELENDTPTDECVAGKRHVAATGWRGASGTCCVAVLPTGKLSFVLDSFRRNRFPPCLAQSGPGLLVVKPRRECSKYQNAKRRYLTCIWVFHGAEEQC